MLSIGVDATAIGISMVERPAITGCNAGGQASIASQGEDVRAAFTGDVGRAVGRAVVDDEDIHVRQLIREIREDAGQVLLLVPGRNEHDRVAHGDRCEFSDS
jgi:hypothetical protein